jgi:serine/threonine protein kinase
MECPDPRTLSLLIVDSTTFVDAQKLWNHLETCNHCQTTLDRLSDDQELKKWRRTSSSGNEGNEDSEAIAELLERLAWRDSNTDDSSAIASADENGIDHRIIDSFEPSPVPGELGILDTYRIKRILGHGGMAMVFEATDGELNRSVALKVLRTKHTDSASRERFIREAKSLAGVKHPNVIAIHGVLPSLHRPPIIAMELVDSGSLQDILKEQECVSTQHAARWIMEAAKGLEAVHRAGLVHRDIKPSNILLASQGGQLTAKIADFGLARAAVLETKATQTGVLVGTPAYMSPEHVSAPEMCDTRSDIYSLGVTLYELLTGEVPFRGPVHTVLQRICREEPAAPATLNAEIPRDLDTICTKAMHREPSHRYQTAMEFADDLHRWLCGDPIHARPATKIELLTNWYRRNTKVAILVVGIASLLITLAAVSSYSAITIRSSAMDLQKEKELVEKSSEQLQKAVSQSQSQRKIAADTLNTLVSKVQMELASRPGTLTLRQSLLDAAADGLDKITRDASSKDVDAIRIEAYIRKGEIYDTLGRGVDSEREFSSARQIAEEFLNQEPDNVEAQRELGNVLVAQADVATRRGALDAAMPLYVKALSLREKEIERLSTEASADKTMDNSFQARRAVVIVLQRLGDVLFHQSKWDESARYLSRSLELAKVNAQGSPTSPFAKRDLSLAYQRMGTIGLLRRSANVEEYFQNAIRLNRELLETDADNKIYLGDLGYLLGTMSKLSSERGDHEAAIMQAHESKQRCESVSELDPQDTDAKIKAAMSWITLHDVYFKSGKLSDAEHAISRFLEQNNRLVESNPTTSKFSMIASLWAYAQAGLQLRQGRIADAIESMRQSVECLKRCQNGTESPPETFAPMIAIYTTTIQGMEYAQRRLTGNEVDGDSELEPDVRLIGLSVQLYEVARAGKSMDAIAIGRQIELLSSANPIIGSANRVTVARAYAVAYSHLIELAAEGRDEAQKAMEECSRAAIGQLKPLLAMNEFQSNPSAKATLLLERDFDSLRQQPEFMELSQ